MDILSFLHKNPPPCGFKQTAGMAAPLFGSGFAVFPTPADRLFPSYFVLRAEIGGAHCKTFASQRAPYCPCQPKIWRRQQKPRGFYTQAVAAAPASQNCSLPVFRIRLRPHRHTHYRPQHFCISICCRRGRSHCSRFFPFWALFATLCPGGSSRRRVYWVLY